MKPLGPVSQTQIKAFSRIARTGSLETLQREDAMEKAADLLEDPFARTFFTHLLGFPRLLLLWIDDREWVKKQSKLWIRERFVFLEELKTLKLGPLLDYSMASVNHNITFKRMTSILSTAERAVLAEGLLDAAALFYKKKKAPEDELWPKDKQLVIENTLEKVFFSSKSGIDVLNNWKRKQRN